MSFEFTVLQQKNCHAILSSVQNVNIKVGPYWHAIVFSGQVEVTHDVKEKLKSFCGIIETPLKLGFCYVPCVYFFKWKQFITFTPLNHKIHYNKIVHITFTYSLLLWYLVNHRKNVQEMAKWISKKLSPPCFTTHPLDLLTLMSKSLLQVYAIIFLFLPVAFFESYIVLNTVNGQATVIIL